LGNYYLNKKQENMKVKYNESTDLRPEGGRLIDAPLVIIDIKENTKRLRNEPAWKNGDRNAMTLYKTNGMRIVLVALHEDTLMKKHTNDGIICVQVLEGEINFITDEQPVVLKKGQMITLHKGLAHSVAAIKESVFLLTLNTSSDKKF
jgi:quercetin dioxygenase-like cupin family protein